MKVVMMIKVMVKNKLVEDRAGFCWHHDNRAVLFANMKHNY
jgi:hypothetical protein